MGLHRLFINTSYVLKRGQSTDRWVIFGTASVSDASLTVGEAKEGKVGETVRSILTRLPTPPFYFRQALKRMSDSTTMPSSPFPPSHSPLLSNDWLNGRPARPKQRRRSKRTSWTAVEEMVQETGSEEEATGLLFWDPHPSKSRRMPASPRSSYPPLSCRVIPRLHRGDRHLASERTGEHTGR